VNSLRTVFLSRFVWIFLVLVAVSFSVNRWVDHEGGARHVVEDWGLWAPLIAFVIQTVTTMTPIGAVFIAVVNGMLFPLWLAISINLSSGVVGGIGMYFLWRRGDHEFDIQSKMAILPRWFRRHAGDNLLFLVVLRLLPWAGGGVADLMAGAHRIPVRTQLASLLLGYFPGSVLYALMGAGLIKLGAR
jgi:uncharacterized membrane protein YdjX (TVP38/TMEM64 family)